MKITELSQEQRSKLVEYKDMYINKFFNANPTNEKDLVEYMHWFYQTFKISENKSPEVILCDSPYEVLLEIQKIKKTEKVEWYEYSYYLSAFNSWISYYDFFDKECFTLKKSEIFNEYKKILDLNILWAIPFENYVFVSRNAVKYVRDNQKKLHSVYEPAVQFGGEMKYHLYFVHGVGINRDLFKKLVDKTYTFQDWIQESNEEVKSAILSFFEERWGSEYLYRFLSEFMKEIDTYTDKKADTYLEGTTKGMNIGVYTLYKGNVNDIEIAFVRCYCPSTDRMFFLSVDPINTNAKDAIASLYRVPNALMNDIKYIQRQGERFSTIFTDNGLKKLKSLSKDELGDLVPLSGDEYFDKMRYEY